MSKISLYIIIGLLFLIGGGYFYFANKVSDLETENLNLLNEKKEELQRVRDSAYVEIENIIEASDKTFDSIVNLPPEIKYIPFEKEVYIDRTYEEALEVIKNYKYE